MSGAAATFDEAGTGTPALVFLHGIGGHRSNFAGQLAHFAGRHRCVSWSMPGYDDSPALPEVTFPALAGAVVELLDLLTIDRAVVVGHSMGGMVAQELAATFPERVRGLVLVATSASFGAGSPRFAQRFRAERLGPLDAGRTTADMAPAIVARLVHRPLPAAVHDAAVAGMAAIPAATYRAAVECILTFDRRESLGALAVPTLLVAGAADPLVPLAVMEEMAATIAEARLVVVPGAGHLVNLEAPQRFDEVLERWLAEVAM